MLVGHKVKARFRGDVLFQHKAVGVKQLRQIDIAVRNGVNRRAGVDPRQAFAQLFAVARHIGFGQQNAIGVANLRLGEGELVHLLVGVNRVDQGDHPVQQVALAEDLVGEKGLNNRAGVGHTGAFDYQAVEGDIAAIAAVEQVEKSVFQLAGAGAADAAVGQRFDLGGAIANQLIVNGHFTELVLDDCDFKAVLFVEDMAQQGGFARAKKAGK
ncbi:hypothetical protein D3C75_225490 [compost metagenome]